MKNLKHFTFGLIALLGLMSLLTFCSCDGDDEECWDSQSKSEIIKKAAPGTNPKELPC